MVVVVGAGSVECVVEVGVSVLLVSVVASVSVVA